MRGTGGTVRCADTLLKNIGIIFRTIYDDLAELSAFNGEKTQLRLTPVQNR
jgi:hypothetical protein